MLPGLPLEQAPGPPAWVTGDGGLGQGSEVLPGWRLEPTEANGAPGVDVRGHGESEEEHGV